jgi:glutamyl-Q tRNA(Asp) synthetase
MARACEHVGALRWYDHQHGEIKANPARFGDVVLARKDVAASYHLCVTLDDAYQEINLVTRGQDLMPFTDIHVLLQKLFSLPQPDYHHHKLLCDKNGNRFAKRDKAVTLRHLRQNGHPPEEIKAYVMRHL